MGFAKVTYYRGYQIKTRVEPTHKPNPGFVGRVNVEADGVQIVTDTTQVMSNFIQLTELSLAPLEISNQTNCF